MATLTPKQDAFGRVLHDHLKGNAWGAIVERSDGLAEPEYNVAWYFSEYKTWPAHLRRALRLARGKVLDVGCGAGRHALHLQGKGMDVLGIDNSPLAVRVCKLRGLKKAKAMSITQVTRRLGIFDTIIMLGNNFGLLGSFKRARWLLRRWRSMTSDGGCIIAQTFDPYDTTEPAHLAYHKLNRSRGRMGGRVKIRVRYKLLATPWMDYLFASRDEVRRIVAGTGWEVGRFVDSEGPGYIVVLQKEALP